MEPTEFQWHQPSFTFHIQEYQIHLPKEARDFSCELRKRSNLPRTIRKEKEILQFYVSGTTNVISSESASKERSENGSREVEKKDRGKKLIEEDSTNTEGVSSSAREFS